MKNFSILPRGSTLLFTAAAALLFVYFGISVRAEELPAIPVTPATTKVLILPTLDLTGDSPAMQQEHVNFGNHRLEYEFITREFQVIGPEMAIRAARSADSDLDDEDSRTKAAMKQMGGLTGADWVVSASVVEVGSDKSRFGNRRAKAKVRLRIFDMKQDAWIADRYYEDHKDSFGIGVGTTGLFRAAIDTTLQRSTSNLLSPYPQIVHVSNEFAENDYLAGQREPFTGDPAKPFAGLPSAATTSSPSVQSAASPPPTDSTSAAPSAAAPTDQQSSSGAKP